jgi:hypothetical protein
MNIFFRIGKWWESRKSVRNLDFEQRMRLVERTQEAQMRAIQSLMIRTRKIEEYTRVK